MNKFTIFTIILAVSVMTVTMDLAVRDYFGVSGQASVLTNSEEPQASQPAEVKKIESTVPANATVPAEAGGSEQGTVTSSALPAPLGATLELPARTRETIAPLRPSAITSDKVSQAGFTATLQEQHFNGKLYQLLDITKNPVEAISFYELQEKGTPIASITEISLKDEIRALQLYVLLQNKTKPYIDLSLNETNAYGDRSFYINHAKKPDEAFLTVKIGRMMYGFAYVKTYHPQIKKLIELLSL